MSGPESSVTDILRNVYIHRPHQQRQREKLAMTSIDSSDINPRLNEVASKDSYLHMFKTVENDLCWR